MASTSDKQKGPAEEPQDEMPDLYPLIRGKVDDGRFTELTVTREDCMALGRMYNTDGIKGYASSVLRVVRNSPLFAVMIMLVDDPGFRAALGIGDEGLNLLELPVFVDANETVYACDVPADVVWASVAFIQNTWGVKYGIAAKFDPAAMSDYDFEHFVARLKFAPEDEQAVLAARKTAPDAVNTVFCALVRQSALFGSAVQKHAAANAAPPVDLLDLPSAPQDPPGEPSEQPVSERQELPESRQISNAAIAEEVCLVIRDRCARSGRFAPHHADHFCETVRNTLKALETENGGVHIAQMDGYAQGTMLATNSAMAITFAFTLMSGNNNPFLNNLIDAYLMIPPTVPEVVHGEGDTDDARA
jgi:hypothetical protein